MFFIVKHRTFYFYSLTDALNMLKFFVLYFWDNKWEYIDIYRGFLIYKLFLFAVDLKNGANAGIYLNFHLAKIYQSKACINKKKIADTIPIRFFTSFCILYHAKLYCKSTFTHFYQKKIVSFLLRGKFSEQSFLIMSFVYILKIYNDLVSRTSLSLQ